MSVTEIKHLTANARVSAGSTSGFSYANAANIVGEPDGAFGGYSVNVGDSVTVYEPGLFSIPTDATVESVRFDWFNDEAIIINSTSRIWYNSTAYGASNASFVGNGGTNLVMGSITPEVINGGNYQLLLSGTSSKRRLDALRITVTYSTSGPAVKRWNGTGWVGTTFTRRWDGAQWVDAQIVRY